MLGEGDPKFREGGALEWERVLREEARETFDRVWDEDRYFELPGDDATGTYPPEWHTMRDAVSDAYRRLEQHWLDNSHLPAIDIGDFVREEGRDMGIPDDWME